MPRVLFVSDHDPIRELGRSALFAEEVERRWIRDPGSAIELARLMQPRLVYIDIADAERAQSLIRELRGDEATRPTAIAVVSHGEGDASARAFDAAGATVVLQHPFEPELWDDRLQELVNVPWRRDARIPVRLSVWSRLAPNDAMIEGTALNVSVRGLLLETATPLEPGLRADISFTLPGQEHMLEVVGQVVRSAEDEGSHRSGIEFQVLRGSSRQHIATFVAEALEAAADETRQVAGAPLREGEQWEAELRASEARKRAILDSALDCIVTVDHEGRIQELNPAAERAFGLRCADVLGRKLAGRILPPEVNRQVEDQLRTLVATHRISTAAPFETVARRADGSEFPVEASICAAYVKGRLLVTAYLRDIEERRRSEEAQRASEERLRALFENGSDGLLLLDGKRRILYRSPANRRLLGWEDEQMLGQQMGSRVHEQDLAHLERVFQQALQSPREPVTVELRVQHADSGWRWLEIVFNNLLELPSLSAVVVNYRDITSRREREEQEARLIESIQTSAQQWRQTVDSLESAVLILDAEGRVLRANRTTRDLIGCSFSEMKGRALASLTGHEPWDGLLELFRPQGPGRTASAAEVRDRETGRLWSLSCRGVTGGGEESQTLLIARDVTRLTELQEQLQRSELMSAMGGLVAGVAHEVRSPLFAISATVDAWERRWADNEEARPFFATVRRELSRVSRLMTELLDYGRPAPASPRRALPLGEAVTPALAAVRDSAAAAEVAIDAAIPAELPPIAMDERLSQVFRNLLENAIQHTPRGGRVRVEASLGRDPGLLEVRVADEGPGFPPGEEAHLFDPFFTRRPGGTGLGLSIVKRIVQEHGGWVAPEGAAAGATMLVTLPVSPRSGE
jgi:PAS domain S-box-containing protein